MPTFSATLDPVTNRETWIDAVQFFDQETNETLDLEGKIDSATITLREQGSKAQVLSGTIADGTIVVLPDGVIQWEFSADEMGSLCNRTYDIGAILTKDGQTVEFLLGSIPVLDGVVST